MSLFDIIKGKDWGATLGSLADKAKSGASDLTRNTPGGMGGPGGMGQAPDDMGRGRMDIPEGLEDWLSAATDVPDEIRTWLESLIEMQNSTPPDEPQ